MLSINLLWGYRAWLKPPNGALRAGAAEETLWLKGRERDRRDHTGAGILLGIFTALRTSADFGDRALLLRVYLQVSPSFSVSPAWRERKEPHGFWSHTCFLPFRERQGPWLVTAGTRQPVEGTFSAQHGVILVSQNAVHLLFILECLLLALLYLYSRNYSTLRNNINNSQCNGICSGEQNAGAGPCQGQTVQWRRQYITENSVILGLLSPGKGTGRGRWSSKRQVAKASP